MSRGPVHALAALPVLLLAVTGLPAAAQAGPEVMARTDRESTVVVTLREQADLELVRGADRAKRVKRTVRALLATADTAQAPLLGRLRQFERTGAVREFTPLWVTNAVSVTATQTVIAELAARADVAAVTRDEIVLVPAADPEPNQQAIGAPTAWAAGHDGQGAVVAVLDSGVDRLHPDLAGRWRGGTNSWFDPYGQHTGSPTDLTGHGTAIAGVAVGGDAGGTSIGTAPGARWIAARVFNDAGTSTVTAVHQAFQWALDPDGDPTTADAPAVVNGSWSIGAGGPGCDLTFQPDVQALRSAGIVPVFAAGNYGSTQSSSASPANYPESLSVGSVASSNLIHSSSSRGPSSCGGRSRVFPDLVAPGVDILSADRYGLYQIVSGTSVAAPHVSGAAALIAGAAPGRTVDQLQAALTGTATDLGTAGPDNAYGNGLLDVPAALQAIPPPPSPDFAVSLTADQPSVQPASTGTFTVLVDPRDGFTGDVTLTVAGLEPAQASGAFDPAVVAGSGTSSLTVSTTQATSPGSHPFTVSAHSGALSHEVTGSLTVTAPAGRLEFSTRGPSNPPGVAGAADDADLYGWDGGSPGAFSRTLDLTATPYSLPAKARVDGFDRLDDTRFFLSFKRANTWVPGLGKVQDEDIVRWDGSAWSVFFDGTAHGLRAGRADIDAFSVVAPKKIWFSTLGSVRLPGVTGTPDDADIYRYRGGKSYSRAWDATANGLTGAADVDGLVRIDARRFYLSFSATDTPVPGLGPVQDEDVVLRDASSWAVYFDGTSHGLTSGKDDIDAFDLR